MAKKQAQNESTMLMYGILLALVAVIILLVLLVSKSQTDDSSQTATITNSNPTVDSVTISTSSGGSAASAISLTENTTTTIYIHGTATDNNGCEEIDDVSTGSLWDIRLYRTSIGDETDCTVTNSTSCYVDTEQNADLTNCSTGGSDTDIDYEMDIPVQYYADATDAGAHSATDWTAWVGVTDDNAGVGSSTATTEVNTLTALDVSSPIAYGSLALGAYSAEQTITITNTGNNNALDPTIEQSADWSCTVGSIPKSNVHWSISPTAGGQTGYDAGTAVSASADSLGLSILKTTNGAASTDDVYTILRVPTTGASGSCTSTLTFTAA